MADVSPKQPLAQANSTEDVFVTEGTQGAPSVIYVNNGIAAEVEGQVITVKEVHDRVAEKVPALRRHAQDQETYERLLVEAQEEILQELVAQKLFVTKFNALGSKVPRAGMDAYKQDYVDSHFGPRGPKQRQNYYRHLMALGETPLAFQKKLEQDLEASIVSQSAYEDVSKNNISPKALRDFYNEHKFCFYQEAAVKLRMITLKPVGKESPAQLEELAKIVQEELKKGVPFAHVAKTYSQDEMASRGGDYGWITRLALRSDLFDAAFALKPGELSPIIRRDNVRYFLMAEDKHPERFQPFEDPYVQTTLHQKFYEKKRQEAHLAFVSKLRNKDGFYVKRKL